ncbi:MAG: NifB/NifX family molybdenum-iron cluster-binding protein [Desulfovibrio sp.]
MANTEIHPTALLDHPCFNNASRQSGIRLHLPIAPRSNYRIKYSAEQTRGYAISAEEALLLLDRTLADKTRKLEMVGITGPGDPLAEPAVLFRVLGMVRAKYPDLPLCITTVGIGVELHIEELKALNLSHVNLLVDCVEPDVAEKLYAWIRPSARTVPLSVASCVLLKEQTRAVSALCKAGIPVKVNTTVYSTKNADHVEDIAAVMAGLGADMMAVNAHRELDVATDLPALSTSEFMQIRTDAERYLPLVSACKSCGSQDTESGEGGCSGKNYFDTSMSLFSPTSTRNKVAVASSTGMDVDMHLGHAQKILIYGHREDGLACLLETRAAPPKGSGDSRWETLATDLGDCFALLASSAGEKPKEILSRMGLPVIITDGGIEGTVDVLYGGGKKKGQCRK